MRTLFLFLTCCFYIFVSVLIPVFGLFGSFLLGVPIYSWAFIGAYVLFVVVSCIVISCRMGLYCVPAWCVVRVGCFSVSCHRACVLFYLCSRVFLFVFVGVRVIRCGGVRFACCCAGRLSVSF